MALNVFLVIGIVFSALVGVFLNRLIAIVPLKMEEQYQAELNTLKGISAKPFIHYKPYCHYWWPVLTHIKPVMLRQWQALRYLFVELFCVLGSLYIYSSYGMTIQTIIYLVFFVLCMTLAATDLETRLLPDVIIFPLLWMGLVLNSFNLLPSNLHDALYGVVGGYMALYLMGNGYRLLKGHDGLGMGDAKLLAAMGAWFGWQNLPNTLLMASLTGLVCCGVILATSRFHKNSLKNGIPFGPFIIIGALSQNFFI